MTLSLTDILKEKECMCLERDRWSYFPIMNITTAEDCLLVSITPLLSIDITSVPSYFSLTEMSVVPAKGHGLVLLLL